MNILNYSQFCEKKNIKKHKKAKKDKKTEDEESLIYPIKKPAKFWNLAGVV